MPSKMHGKMEELVVYGGSELMARRQKVDIPTPGPDEVLIKVVAVGLNPKDWKYTEDLDATSALNAGDDLAGTIVGIGSLVTGFQLNDHVAALHRLGEPSGGYAEYAIAPASTTFHLPSNFSFEAGATVPLVAMTAAIALYQALQLPLPTSPSTRNTTPLLIYGASSSVGIFALQFAQLSGLGPIIAVAGAGMDVVHSHGGAIHTIDYRSGPTAHLQSEIRRALGGAKLLHAFDCVGQRGSWEVCAGVLAPGGHLNMIDWGNVLDWDPINDVPGPNAWTPPDTIRLDYTLVSSAHGVAHDWIDAVRAAKDADFAFMWFRYMGLLMQGGRLRPHRYEILPRGLDGIVDGLRDLQANRVSGRKLVVRIADTPGLESRS